MKLLCAALTLTAMLAGCGALAPSSEPKQVVTLMKANSIEGYCDSVAKFATGVAEEYRDKRTTHDVARKEIAKNIAKMQIERREVADMYAAVAFVYGNSSLTVPELDVAIYEKCLDGGGESKKSPSSRLRK